MIISILDNIGKRPDFMQQHLLKPETKNRVGPSYGQLKQKENGGYTETENKIIFIPNYKK